MRTKTSEAARIALVSCHGCKATGSCSQLQSLRWKILATTRAALTHHHSDHESFHFYCRDQWFCESKSLQFASPCQWAKQLWLASPLQRGRQFQHQTMHHPDAQVPAVKLGKLPRNALPWSRLIMVRLVLVCFIFLNCKTRCFWRPTLTIVGLHSSLVGVPLGRDQEASCFSFVSQTFG